MAVDVVVVNYKQPDYLEEFCRSYQDAKYGGCTLTVVDVTIDSPYAGQIATQYADEFLEFAENIGYGRACNWGALEGTNDVILLANADTLLSSGLQECENALLAHDDWGVLGPRQVNANNQIVGAGITGHPRSPYPRGWNEPDHGQYNTVDEMLSVSGSLYFIKRTLWKELAHCPQAPESIGAFLETPHYFEETWCSFHARAHGYKCIHYGPVCMTHYWHTASPHGGWADQQFAVSQQIYREACSHHGIECE